VYLLPGYPNELQAVWCIGIYQVKGRILGVGFRESADQPGQKGTGKEDQEYFDLSFMQSVIDLFSHASVLLKE
jgi:hypothetical protein